LADDKLKLYRSEDLQTFQGQARVSPPTSTNWYISTSGSSIFPLKKIKTKKQIAQLPLHSLLKKYVLTMLDLLIHAQTSDIPEVLLALKQVMF